MIRAQVSVLGQLAPQLTGTGFCIHPVVGWVDREFRAVPDPAEVQSVFEVPLEFLLEPDNRKEASRARWGIRIRTDEYLYEDRRIWGATAAILTKFFEVINEKTIK